MKEANVQRLIQMRVSELGGRVLRNNVGLAWVGKLIKKKIVWKATLQVGDVLIRNARPLHAGLEEGSSDLIGWRPLLITQEMVGRTVAQFVGLEIKKTSGGVTSDAQKQFISTIKAAGALAGVVKSIEETNELFRS